MSDRSIPFDDNQRCDDCGKNGAYDFMGDYLCQSCMEFRFGIRAQKGEDTEDKCQTNG